MSTDPAYTTICFKGDVRNLTRNPFKVQCEFGEVVTVSVGDAFEEIENLTVKLEILTKKIEAYE